MTDVELGTLAVCSGEQSARIPQSAYALAHARQLAALLKAAGVAP